eukprot:186869_1
MMFRTYYLILLIIFVELPITLQRAGVLVCSQKGSRGIVLAQFWRRDQMCARFLFCSPPSGQIQLQIHDRRKDYLETHSFSVKYGRDTNLNLERDGSSTCQTKWTKLEPQGCDYLTISKKTKVVEGKIEISMECSEPRAVTKLLWECNRASPSQLLHTAKRMRSDPLMNVTDKNPGEWLFAQHLCKNFYKELYRRVHSSTLRPSVMSTKNVLKLVDVYAVFWKLRSDHHSITVTRVSRVSDHFIEHSVIRFGEDEAVWAAIFTDKDSLKKQFGIMPTKDEIFEYVLRMAKQCCTGALHRSLPETDDQLSVFQKHLNFLTSTRFEEETIENNINLLTKMLTNVSQDYLDRDSLNAWSGSQVRSYAGRAEQRGRKLDFTPNADIDILKYPERQWYHGCVTERDTEERKVKVDITNSMCADEWYPENSVRLAAKGTHVVWKHMEAKCYAILANHMHERSIKKLTLDHYESSGRLQKDIQEKTKQIKSLQIKSGTQLRNYEDEKKKLKEEHLEVLEKYNKTNKQLTTYIEDKDNLINKYKENEEKIDASLRDSRNKEDELTKTNSALKSENKTLKRKTKEKSNHISRLKRGREYLKAYYEELRPKEADDDEHSSAGQTIFPPSISSEEYTDDDQADNDVSDSVAKNAPRSRNGRNSSKDMYHNTHISNILTKMLGPSLLGCIIAGGTMVAVIFNILYQGAVGDWFRKNASCKVLIGKSSFCGTLITFLFGA